jgi:hypothetical protein
MSVNHPVESNEPLTGGHPHDLLARLYREIGISAVAAALEAAQFSDVADETPEDDARWTSLGGDLAA